MAGLHSDPQSTDGSPEGAHFDDWQLVQRAVGNPQAFEPLFNRYWDAVYRYCFYRLGNIEDAEDAAIQILTNVFNALPRVEIGAASFRSWLFVIAHNEVVSHRRHRAKRPSSLLSPDYDQPDASPSPEELALQSSQAEETRQLVTQLTERPRQVVELRLAGLTDGEIAEVLGVSQGAVRQAQFRAIGQLKAFINASSAEGRSADAR